MIWPNNMKLRLKLHLWCRFVFHSQNKLSFRSPELAMVEMKLPKYIGPHFRHNYTASKNVRERGGDSRDIFLPSSKKFLDLTFICPQWVLWCEKRCNSRKPHLKYKKINLLLIDKKNTFFWYIWNRKADFHIYVFLSFHLLHGKRPEINFSLSNGVENRNIPPVLVHWF